MLDLSAFEKVITSLTKGLLALHNEPEHIFIRDACIQRFEYVYEFSYKMLRRHLEVTERHASSVDALSFPALIRPGNERGILNADWSTWKNFREARNSTSHTYDEDKASQVLTLLPQFLEEAHHLLHELQRRQIDTI